MASDSLQTIPAPSGFANFQYETLKSSSRKPSIRLAVLQPGTRDSRIRIKLVHEAFADRPKYEALSYAWGKPDVVKDIDLNGTKVEIRENLWFALVHLRNTTEERFLWIDALCINQADLEERSEQVQLMAYIYSRAKKVIVWLGLIPESSFTSIALARQPYWCRVWIVQEVGSARILEIHWGVDIKSESDAQFLSTFIPWEQFFSQMPSEEGHKNPAINILRQREGRHGENFLLASLMEACQESLCEEPRDKVYAFLGVAHDCEDGKFPVDYSKSLFELYEDVIRFHLNSEGGPETAVHFSQLVQRLFGGPKAMQQDLERTLDSRFDPWLTTSHVKEITVKAWYAKISLVGPSYDEFIALPEATRKWKTAISMYDWQVRNVRKVDLLEQLRSKNEILMAMLHDLDPSYASRMVSFRQRRFWDGARALDEVYIGKIHGHHHVLLPKSILNGSFSKCSAEDQPRLFCTHDGVLGLMPPHARRGDILFRFCKSDLALVFRCLERSDDVNFIESTIFGKARLIGKALLAPEVDNPLDGFPEDKAKLDIEMDPRLLQQLTE